MDFLIDTQILIWFQINEPQLKPKIADLLNNIDNNVFVSDISLFEISIKSKLGKLPNKFGSVEEIIKVSDNDGFILFQLNNVIF